MTHPIVKRFLAGKNDAGGTIHALELEIERLQKRLAELEAAQQSVQPTALGGGKRGHLANLLVSLGKYLVKIGGG